MPTAKSPPAREDRIRARAHEIWIHEGRPEGRDLEHWRQAEAEIANDPPSAARRRAAAPASGPAKAPSAKTTPAKAKTAASSKAKSAPPKSPPAATSRRTRAGSKEAAR